MHDPGSLVFLGSCQSAGLRATWNRFVAEPGGTQAASIDIGRIGEAERRTLAAADTIAVQVADMNAAIVDDLAGLRARVVPFPYLSGFMYFPFATHPHPNFGKAGFGELGLYSQEVGGDAFLNRLLRDGTPPDAAVEIYRTLDYDRVCRFDRRFEMIMETQRARDARSGIETADFIERNLGKDILFGSRGHPTLRLFLHLAVQVFERLGAPARALAAMECDLLRCPMHIEEVPINPLLLRRFGYPAADPGRRYHYGATALTFDEYVACYMTGHYEHALMAGIKAARGNRYEEAIERLFPALPGRSLSRLSLVGLARCLAHLGRQDDAIATLQQGVERFPGDAEMLMALGRFQYRWRPPRDAEPTVLAVLALHPDCAEVQTLLSLVLEKQGRHAEALSYLRRAHGRRRPERDAAASLRYARLSLKVGNLAAAAGARDEAQRAGADAHVVEQLAAEIRAAERPAPRPDAVRAAAE